MTTVMARRVASTPVRSAAQTWEKIIALLAPDPGSPARKDLAAAAGVGCSSISSEATKDAAIVVWGGGPRARVYCVFDEDAITRDGVNEDALPKSPTEGDWRMSIPCLPEDVEWSAASLAAVSTRITAHSLDDDVDDGDSDGKADSSSAAALSVNLEEFMKQ
jgi:hypothetical protein